MKKNNNTVKDYVRVKCSETATETDSVFAVVPGDNVKYLTNTTNTSNLTTIYYSLPSTNSHRLHRLRVSQILTRLVTDLEGMQPAYAP